MAELRQDLCKGHITGWLTNKVQTFLASFLHTDMFRLQWQLAVYYHI